MLSHLKMFLSHSNISSLSLSCFIPFSPYDLFFIYYSTVNFSVKNNKLFMDTFIIHPFHTTNISWSIKFLLTMNPQSLLKSSCFSSIYRHFAQLWSDLAPLFLFLLSYLYIGFQRSCHLFPLYFSSKTSCLNKIGPRLQHEVILLVCLLWAVVI